MSGLGAVACSHCSGSSESAAWSFSAEARQRCVVPPPVTLVPLSCVTAWPRLMGWVPIVLVLGALMSPPDDEVHDGVMEALPRAC